MKKIALLLLAFSATASAEMTTIFRNDESQRSFFGITDSLNHMRLSQAAPDSVLMLGDSITQGLSYQGLRFKHVNLGVGGDTAHGLKTRIKNVDIDKYRGVFIEIGTNNILMGEPGPFAGMEIAEAIDYAAPKAKNLFVSEVVISNRKLHPDLPADAPAVNDIIKTTCAKYKNCKFIPLPAGLVDEHGLNQKYALPDGIHLNGKGYALWKEQLNKSMAEFPYSLYYKYFK